MYSNVLHQSASNSTLKRTRSSEHVQLPQLEPDMYLRVYTHKSLRRTCASANEYEDNERLSLVGEKVFDAAVTTALFYERPLLEMEAKKRDIISWMNIDSWVRLYQMREKVRCHPEQFETLFSPEETKALFYAYVGAVFVNLGMDVVQAWINALIELGGTQRSFPLHRKVKNLPTSQLPPILPPPPPRPQFISSQPFVQFSHFPAPMSLFSPAPMANNALIGLGGTQRLFPFHRKVKNLPTRRSQPPPIQPPPAPRPQFISPQPGSFVQFSRFPAPMPLFPPTPMAKPPPPPKLPSPTTPAQPHQAILPQFNEKASQQTMVVEYPAQSTPHTGTWTVNCVVTSGFSIFRLGISVLLLSFLIALYCFYYCM